MVFTDTLKQVQNRLLVIISGLFLALFLSLFTSATADAATRTWDGGGGDNNWSTAANWSSDLVPGAADIARFNTGSDDVIFDVTDTVDKVRVLTGFTGTVTMASSTTLTVVDLFRIQPSGVTFDASAGTLDLYDYWHQNGTFIAPSGNMTISNIMTFSDAGTFTHSSGTVTLDGTGSSAIDTTSPLELYDLVINKGDNADLVYYEVGATNGYLTVNDLTVTVGELKSTSGAFYINVKGNVDIGSGSDEAHTLGLNFTGTAAQNFDLTGAEDNYEGLITINKSAGTVTQTSDLTCNEGAFCVFTMTDGDYTTNSNSFAVDSFTQAQDTFTEGNNFTSDGDVTMSGGTFTTSATGTFTLSDGLILNGGTFDPSTETLLVGDELTLAGGSLTMGAANLTVTNATTLTSGTLNLAASPAVDLNGAFTLTTGTFTATDDTMDVDGTFTVNGGTFNNSNGRIDLKGGSATDLAGSASWSFYDLYINKSTGVELDLQTSTATVANSLNLMDGNVNTTTGSFFQLSGNLTDHTNLDASSAGINFIGSATQTITFVSTSFDGDITVNKTNSTDKIELAAAVTLNGTNQDLTLTKGTLDLSGYGFVLNGTSGTMSVAATGHIEILNDTTITVNSGYPTFADGSSVTYTGSSITADVEAWVYDDLIINGSGSTFSLAATTDINGDLTLTAGTLDASASNYDMTVAGNWTDTGSATFTERAGTVTFDGASSNINSNEAFNAVTINSSGTETLSATLDVNGLFTITAGTFDVGASSYAMTVAGGWTDTGAGTFTERAGTVTFDGTGTVNANETFNDVTINASGGTVTLGAALDLADDLTITDGALDVSGSNYGITLGGDWSDTGSGTFTQQAGTVTFDGASASLNSNEALNAVTINSSGTVTLGAALDADGLITLSGGTLDASASNYGITVGGGWADSGSGTFTERAATVTFDGTGTLTSNEEFNNVTINASGGTVTLGAALDVNGDITMTAGALDVSGSNYGITLAGSWTDTGAATLTEQSGTLTLDGTSTINSNDAFYNVTMDTSGNTITLGGTFSANGDLVLTAGTLDLNGNDVTVNQSTKTFTVAAVVTLKLEGGETVTTNSTYPSFSAGAIALYDGGSGGTVKDWTYSNLTINGTGTFVLAADTDVNALVTLTSGTLDATVSNYDMTVGGGWTDTGAGVFTERAGTVTFDGTGTVNSNEEFYDFTVNASGGTVTLGSALEADGTLTLTDGTLDASGSNYSVTAAAWTDTGSGVFTERAGTVIFDGTGTVNSNEAFNAVTINSGGTVTLGAALDANGLITLTGGTFDVSSSNYGVTAAAGWTDTGAGTFTERAGTVTFDGTGTLNSNDAFNAVTISTGTVTLGAALDVNGLLTISGGSFDASASNYGVTAAAGWTDTGAGTFTERAGTVTFDGTGTVNSNEAFNAVTINAPSGTVTLGAALDANGLITITDGVLDVSASDYGITAAAGWTDTGAGTFTERAGTVTFDGTGTLASNDAFYAVTINAPSGTVTLGAALNADGLITVTDGTFDVSASNYAITAANGWLDSGSGSFTERAGTVTFDSTGSINSNDAFYDVTINAATKIVTLTGNLDVDGDMTITLGTLSAGSYTITVGTNWTKANTAVFTAGTSTVTFDDNSVTSVVDGDTTFNTLTSTTGGKNITFTAGDTTTVATLTLTGASGNLITLRSSSDGTTWLSNITAGTVDYIDVKDGNNSGTAPTQTNSTDSGNNTSWGFNAIPVVVVNSLTQSTDGSGAVDFSFTVSDGDADTLTVKVEYSIDGGSTYEDANVSPLVGTISVGANPVISNSDAYQISGVATTSANTLTGQWRSVRDVLPTTDISNAKMKFTPKDAADGTAVVGSDFILDIVDPTGLANFSSDFDETTTKNAHLEWSPVSESNFNHYEIYYGTRTGKVTSRDSASVTEHDDSNDVALATRTTTSTDISIDPYGQYFKIWAVDDFGNEATQPAIFMSVEDLLSSGVSAVPISVTGSGTGGTVGGSGVSRVSVSDTASRSASRVSRTGATHSIAGEITTQSANEDKSGVASDDEKNESREERRNVRRENTSRSTDGEEIAVIIDTEPVDTQQVETVTVEEIYSVPSSTGSSSGSSSYVVPTTVTELETPEEHWSKDYLNNLVGKDEVIEAATTTSFFEILINMFITPNDAMNRGKAVQLLVTLSGYAVDTTSLVLDAFSDLSPTIERDHFIQFAADEGKVNGYPDGSFKSDDLLNRAETLKLVGEFFGRDVRSDLFGEELLNYYLISENPFTDLDLDIWYAPYVINAYVYGIVEGYEQDGTFRAVNEVTYAEFLKIASLMQNL